MRFFVLTILLLIIFPVISFAACGNNIIEAGEACDGSSLNGNTCLSIPGYKSGTLSCRSDCSGYNVAQCAAGNTITAASCSQSAVQSAVNSAQDGDIVAVPAGTCTWNTHLTITKGISIIGAGIDQTNFVDGVSKAACDSVTTPMLTFSGINNPNSIRISGFSLDGGVNSDGCNKGHIAVLGTSHNIRIDHIKFFNMQSSAIHLSGDPWGVVDHVQMTKNGKNGVVYTAENWGNGVYGDKSWSSPVNWGSGEGLYIEDSTFTDTAPGGASGAVDDCVAGGRFVARYNTLNMDSVQGHGTASSQRLRSCRSLEFYNNTIVTTGTLGNGAYWPGGTAVFYNNIFGSQVGTPIALVVQRALQSYTPWGKCDGSSPYDQNTPGQSGYRCADQPGAGTSNLIGDNNGVPMPNAWIGNALDPIYQWNNVWIGHASVTINDAASIVANRDYYNNVQRPGYTPFVYPHPLVGLSVGNTINAASCSQTDVQNAINSAQDGDTIRVPSGTCAWTSTVNVDIKTILKSLTISGAGIDQTIILDEIPRVAPDTNANMLAVTTANGKTFRLTGFTFKSSPAVTTATYQGRVVIDGDSKAFRIDHNKFDFSTVDRSIFIRGYQFGVIDHNNFSLVNQALTVFHETWGGQNHGDGSWAAPLSLGTEQAVFFEDNIAKFSSSGYAYSLIDGWAGGRYVIRFNQFINAAVDNHGTESSGRDRGIFSWEVYNNTFTTDPGVWQTGAFDVRGGTGVFFNNKMSLPNGFTYIGLNNYRNRDTFQPFGSCDGSSTFDKNFVDGSGQPVVYDSGTHSGASVTDGTLTTSKNWAPNQWVGYSVRNTAKNWGSQVRGNTANTITIEQSAYGQARNWDPGDSFQILRVDVCLDQAGRSTGDLISGDDPPWGTGVMPRTYPNQTLEPVYVWGNTNNGAPANGVGVFGYTIQANRDYYSGVPRPGYTPYTYPHPLTTGAIIPPSPPDTTPPSQVTGLTATAVSQSQINLAWNAASDNVGVAGYRIYRDGTQIATSPTNSYSNTGLAASTTYSYTIAAYDAAGNIGTQSSGASATTQAPDTTQPTVSMTSPAGGTVSGTITISANANDNVGVSGVQFKIDGSNAGSEDTASPYSITWSSTGVANGTHSITAVARDAAGNSATSNAVSVNVQNSAPSAPTNGLVAHWKFNEGSGSVASDSSGSGNTGTIIGGASWTAGKIGSALQFDGVNGRVDAGPLTILEGATAATWTFWVRPGVAGGEAWLTKTASYDSTSWKMGFLDSFCGFDDIAFTFSGGTGGCTLDNTFSAGTWAHVAVVFDGTQATSANRLKIYVNGVSKNVVFGGGSMPTALSSTSTNVNICSYSNGANYCSDTFDEIRIYNRALPEGEVQLLYQEGSSPYSGIILRGRVMRTASVACPSCIVNFTMNGVNGVATTASDGTFMTVLATIFVPGTYNADIVITDGATVKTFKKRIVIA